MDDIAKGRALEEMCETEGWGVVERHIKERIALKEAELLHLPLDKIEPETVRKLRVEMDVLRGVLRFVQDTVEAGREAEKEQANNAGRKSRPAG